MGRGKIKTVEADVAVAYFYAIMEYTLEKQTWTDADFDLMGWHDNYIWLMQLREDLELDIDYILRWENPELEGFPFTFWIAPSTLVFKNVWNITFEFSGSFTSGFEITGIQRLSYGNISTWSIELANGNISFTSNGFIQYIRQQPFHTFGRVINYTERGGISLEQTVNQHNPDRNREDVCIRRNKELADYETAKLRHIAISEKERLEKIRQEGNITTKNHLLNKRELEKQIDIYNIALKGTLFELW